MITEGKQRMRTSDEIRRPKKKLCLLPGPRIEPWLSPSSFSLAGPQLTCRQLGDLAALPCGKSQSTSMVYKGASKGGVGEGVEFNWLLEKNSVTYAGTWVCL